jgi:hypothetical protein
MVGAAVEPAEPVESVDFEVLPDLVMALSRTGSEAISSRFRIL